MKKAFMFAAMAAVLTMASCGKDSQDSQIEVRPTKLEFAKGVDSKSFDITSNTKWKIEAPGLNVALGANVGESEWYTVEPVFGDGNAKVTVTSKEKSEGNKATLKIKIDDKEKSIELIQK
jgi:hypothetical protein